MVSAAGRAFTSQPVTRESFEKYLKAAPKEAVTYAARLSEVLELKAPALTKLRAEAATGALTADHLTQAVQTALLGAVDLARTQQARAETLGWTAESPNRPMAPVVSGTLGQTGATLTLETERGTFTLESPNFGDGNTYLEHTLLRSFVGKTVSVAAWPAATLDGSKRLSVESFAPGAGGPFVSGRLATDGAKVSIRVFPGDGGLVEIRTPALAQRLSELAQLGIILPLPVKHDAKGRYVEVEGNVDDLRYFMLAKAVGNALQMAHGKSRAVSSGAEKLVPAVNRNLAFGHLTADGTVALDTLLETSAYDGARGTLPADHSLVALAELLPIEEDTAPAPFAP